MSSSSAAGSSGRRRRRTSRRQAVAWSSSSGPRSGPARRVGTPGSSSIRSTLCSSRCISRRWSCTGSSKGSPCPPGPVGLLSVTHDVDGARRLTEAISATHPSLRPRFVPPDEVASLEPAMAPGVAACRLDIGYPVGPAAATHAYAARAERAGVEIRIGEATLAREDGRVSGRRRRRRADRHRGRRRGRGSVVASHLGPDRCLATDRASMGCRRPRHAGVAADARPRGGRDLDRTRGRSRTMTRAMHSAS